MCFNKKTGPVLAFVAAIIFVLPGCRIIEDRDACQTYLIVDLAEAKALINEEDGLGLIVQSGDTLHYRAFEEGDIPDSYTVRVSGKTKLLLFSPFDAMSETGMDIEYGQDSPPLLAGTAEFTMQGEQMRRSVSLRKNYCFLSINVSGEQAQSLGLSIESDICGCDAELIPSAGKFYYDAGLSSDGSYSLCLPRLSDSSSLLLHLMRDQRVVRTFNLWSLFESYGYDWSAEDLDDMELSVDYEGTKMSVRKKGWNSIVEIEEII